MRPSQIMQIGTDPEAMDVASSIHFNMVGTHPEMLNSVDNFVGMEVIHIVNNPQLPVTFYNVLAQVLPLLPNGSNISSFSIP